MLGFTTNPPTGSAGSVSASGTCHTFRDALILFQNLLAGSRVEGSIWKHF